MTRIKIPQDLQKVDELFTSHGFKAYLVGGAVRDTILGKEMHDWDLATNATPEQVMSIFHHVIPTGIAHGTVTIHIFGHEIETTTFRTEAAYSDGRHPDSVSYAATIEEDLSRRDFTMNAIAADLATGYLVDPFHGQEDIQNKIIRTVGNPLDRFTEDGLRPVRAVRFAGQLGFTIEEQTFVSLSNKLVLQKTAGISIERFRDELIKILLSCKPSLSLKLLEQTGIMALFMPEFLPCRGCLQSDLRGFHEFDVADHLFYACDGAQNPTFDLSFLGGEHTDISSQDNLLLVRLAALLHAIGKPASRTTELWQGHEIIHFHNHETVGAEITRKLLTRLRFPTTPVDLVTHLVKEHMFYYEPVWSDAAVRRFIVRIGKDNLANLFAVRIADIYGMHNMPVVEGSPTQLNIAELSSRIEKVAMEKSALSLKDLAVNGKDLMASGIPAGKTLGSILEELLETVLDSPAMNEKEKLLSLAKKIYTTKYLV